MGVLFAFLGSTLQAIGLGVMKLQYNVNEKEETDRLVVVRRLKDSGVADRPHPSMHGVSRTQSDENGGGAVQAKPENGNASPAGVKPEVGPEEEEQVAAANFGADSSAASNGQSNGQSNGHTNGLVRAASGASYGLRNLVQRNLSQLTDPEHDESFTPVTGDRHTCNKIPWIWITGFVIFIIGNGGDFYALGVTNQSVVPLVGSWALVMTLGVARFLLKEEINWWDVAACACIVTGIVLTVVFGSQTSAEWELEELLDRYEHVSVQVLIAVLASIIIGSLSVMHGDYLKRKAEATRKMELIKHTGRFVGTLYCLTGATIACFTVLFGKAFSGLLFPLILQGDNKFSSAWAAIIVVAFLISLPSQMYLIHASLMVNDMSFHIPTFYVLWNVGSIVTSAIYYREMDNFKLRNYLGFIGGAVVLFIGCYFTNIASRYKHQNDALESDNVDANKPEGHVPATANGDGGDEGDVSNGAGVSASMHDGRPSADVGLSSEDPRQLPPVTQSISRDPTAFGQGSPNVFGDTDRNLTVNGEPAYEAVGPDWTPFQPPVHQFAPPLNPPLHPLRLYPGVFEIQNPPLAPPRTSWGGAQQGFRVPAPPPRHSSFMSTVALSSLPPHPQEPASFAPGPLFEANGPFQSGSFSQYGTQVSNGANRYTFDFGEASHSVPYYGGGGTAY